MTRSLATRSSFCFASSVSFSISSLPYCSVASFSMLRISLATPSSSSVCGVWSLFSSSKTCSFGGSPWQTRC
uniref:Putative secreted protein n=1 Tax=Anopheles marajoara TaxID=58244 RepID=A0A2M4CF72_9DIPT